MKFALIRALGSSINQQGLLVSVLHLMICQGWHIRFNYYV